MGTNCSSQTTDSSQTTAENVECLICFTEIEHHWVACSQCKIKMHDVCTRMYLDAKGVRFCKCPHCQSIGTLHNDSVQVPSRCLCA